MSWEIKGRTRVTSGRKARLARKEAVWLDSLQEKKKLKRRRNFDGPALVLTVVVAAWLIVVMFALLVS